MSAQLTIVIRRWVWGLIIVALVVAVLAACSPYASVDIGIPFKVGPVTVNPKIGIGGLL
jgi:hypothetical protein